MGLRRIWAIAVAWQGVATTPSRSYPSSTARFRAARVGAAAYFERLRRKTSAGLVTREGTGRRLLFRAWPVSTAARMRLLRRAK